MTIDQPYFMENDEWYYFDFAEKKYKLTEKAPDRAKESYDEYNKMLKLYGYER